MKNLLVFAFCCFILSVNVNAQCKSGKIPKSSLNRTHSNTEIKPDFSTKHRALVDKFDLSVRYNFVKEGNQTYLYIFIVRNKSKKFKLTQETGFTFVAENKEKITIYPCDEFTGGRYMANYMTGAFYKISKNQVEFLKKNEITEITFDIHSEKPISGNVNIEDGVWTTKDTNIYSFKTKILSIEKRKKLRNLANCLLEKI